MPSGYKSGGVDFDDLFDPYVTGTPPAATGYRVAGVDLAGRYAPLVYGTQRADVGYRIAGGADVATLWAAKGTAHYVDANAGLPAEVAIYVAGSSGPLTATASFNLFRNGTTTWDPSGASAWYPSGAAGIGDSYEVMFEVLSGFGGTLSGSTLSTWLALSSTRGLSLAVSRSTSGTTTATRDIRTRIRRVGTVDILANRVTAMTAEVDIS